jgi:hypothetical protein
MSQRVKPPRVLTAYEQMRRNEAEAEANRLQREYVRDARKYGFVAANALQEGRQEAKELIDGSRKAFQKISSTPRWPKNAVRVPPADREAFQQYLYDILDTSPNRFPSYIPLTSKLGNNADKTVHQHLRNVSKPDAGNDCTPFGRNSSMQPHQIVVYAMAALRSLDAIQTPGLLAVHSTGAGKTLIGLAALVAFWNRKVPGTDLPCPIFMVSTKGNQDGNSLSKLASLGMVFFDKFVDDAGNRPFDLASSERGRALLARARAEKRSPLEDEACREHVAMAIRRRLAAGLSAIVGTPTELRRGRNDLYTFTKLANDWPRFRTNAAGMVQHTVFIVDEVQFLLNPPPNEQAFASSYNRVRAFLTSSRDPATTWMLGMTATPGETQEDLRAIMAAISADQGFALTEDRLRGLVSFANLYGDYSHFPKLDVRLQCLPMFSDSRYGRIYAERVRLAKAAFERDGDRKKYYTRLREFGNFLEIPADVYDGDEEAEDDEEDTFDGYVVRTRDRRSERVILPSQKIVRLIQNIRRLGGKHYVYTSSPRTLLLIAHLLERYANLRNLDCTRQGCAMEDSASYFVIIDNVSSTKTHAARYSVERPTRALEMGKRVANRLDNATGSKVKVILATRENFKGVDMNHLRYIHLVEPFFDYQDFVQLMGRGPRYCSHSRTVNRRVDLVLYRTVLDDPRERCPEETLSDCTLWRDSRQSYKDNWLRVESMLQRSSVDYLVFKDTLHQNMVALEEKIKGLVCDDDPIIPVKRARVQKDVEKAAQRVRDKLTRARKLNQTRGERRALHKARFSSRPTVETAPPPTNRSLG